MCGVPPGSASRKFQSFGSDIIFPFLYKHSLQSGTTRYTFLWHHVGVSQASRMLLRSPEPCSKSGFSPSRRKKQQLPPQVHQRPLSRRRIVSATLHLSKICP